jgi:hypothetical protein
MVAPCLIDSPRMRASTWLSVSILVASVITACAASPLRTPGHIQLVTAGLPPGVHPYLRTTQDQIVVESQGATGATSRDLAPGKYALQAAPIQVAGLTYDPVSPRSSFTVRSGKTLTLTVDFQLHSLAEGAAWREVAASIAPEVSPGYAYLSCADSNFCMLAAALGDRGIVQWTWNGAAWSGPTSTGLRPTSITSLSCPSPDFCMMGTGSYQSAAPAFVDVWNGEDWTSGNPATGRTVLFYVAACASTVSCLAIAAVSTGATHQEDLVESWNGAGWVAGPGPAATSQSGYVLEPSQLVCPYDGDQINCLLVSEPNPPSVGTDRPGGSLSAWNGHTWRTILQIVGTQSVGCHTPSSCVAVAENLVPSSGHLVTTYQGTASHWIGYVSYGLYVASQPQCPLTGTCFAAVQPNSATTSVDLWEWSNHHWRATSVGGTMGGDPLLSCAADGFCLAVTDAGTYALG